MNKLVAFDGHHHILIVPRNIGMASIKSVHVCFPRLETGKVMSISNHVKLDTHFIAPLRVPGIEWQTHRYLHVILINLTIHDINTSQTICNTDQPQAANIPDFRVCQ